MEWTTAASLIARAGKQGYDNRHLIQHWWTRAKAYLDFGDTQVVVTGRGNAGKTLLVAQMHGRARDLSYEAPPESRSVEVDAISIGEWTKLVRVLPGQFGYRAIGEVKSFVSNSSLEGVIHVVDFGYVHPRDEVSIETMIERQGLDSLDKLIARNLREDVNNLNLLLADIRKALAQNGSPRWLVIAVNKVDLYPDARGDALRYYHPDGSSEFSVALREFQSEIGKVNLEIFVLQTCAAQNDFHWNGLAVPSRLKPNEQLSIMKEFMRSIAAISRIRA